MHYLLIITCDDVGENGIFVCNQLGIINPEIARKIQQCVSVGNSNSNRNVVTLLLQYFWLPVPSYLCIKLFFFVSQFIVYKQLASLCNGSL